MRDLVSSSLKAIDIPIPLLLFSPGFIMRGNLKPGSSDFLEAKSLFRSSSTLSDLTKKVLGSMMKGSNFLDLANLMIVSASLDL